MCYVRLAQYMTGRRSVTLTVVTKKLRPARLQELNQSTEQHRRAAFLLQRQICGRSHCLSVCSFIYFYHSTLHKYAVKVLVHPVSFLLICTSHVQVRTCCKQLKEIVPYSWKRAHSYFLRLRCTRRLKYPCSHVFVKSKEPLSSMTGN